MKESDKMKSNDIKKSPTLITLIQLCCVIILLVPTGVALASGVAGVDDSAETSPQPGTYKILASDGKIEFPFEIYRGDIRFLCEVNGHQVHMLLDDGFMWDQLLFWGSPDVDSLGLAYDGEIEVGNDNSEKLASKTASGITVVFPGVEFTEQTAVITPLSSGNSSMWMGSVGQISATLFKSFVVDINFDKMIITLIEPEDFKYGGKGVEIPWQPLGFGPWSIPAILQMKDGRKISMKLLMDLGYNDQLQLAVGGEHNITLPEKKLPASLGVNIQGVETRGFIGRLPQIDIGGYKIKDLIVSYVSEEHSNQAVYEAMIGLDLLSRFNLVFDYHRQRLFVEPNKSFKKPFEHNMTGFTMEPTPDGNYVIKQVHKFSPADEAGLQEGDIILKINDKKITDYDFFDLFPMLRRKGEKLNLLIERDGKEKKVTLILRRVI
jgi:hypothetical protein